MKSVIAAVVPAARLVGMVLLGGASIAPAFAACDAEGRCAIAGGIYRVRAPLAAEAGAPRPALVFLHGYDQTPEDFLRPGGWLAAFADRHGVVLVLPEGAGKTWSYPGSPLEGRDDAGFIRAAAKDASARFEIDPARIYVSGFSQGGSMAWSLACEAGAAFAGYAPIAGAFWMPLPAACPGGPMRMLHVHGLSDVTVPMEGRPIGDRFRQADVIDSLVIAAETGRCAAPPPAAEPSRTADEALACADASGCAPGAALRLCLHAGGHHASPTHLEAAWRFFGER